MAINVVYFEGTRVLNISVSFAPRTFLLQNVVPVGILNGKKRSRYSHQYITHTLQMKVFIWL